MPSLANLARIALVPAVGEACISLDLHYFLSFSPKPCAHANATETQSDVESRQYTSPAGPGCFGVWTQTWAQKGYPLPHELVVDLTLRDPALLTRIMSHQCPYGRVLPGQVTWPNSDSKSVMSMCGFKLVAVVYSYVPYVLGGFVVLNTLVSTCRKRRITTTRLYVLLWLAQALLLQECFLKRAFGQPRPGTMMQMRDNDGKFAGSCVESCGMPSSHSMLAIGWIVILLFDRIYRIDVHHSSAYDGNTCGQVRHDMHSCKLFMLSLGLKPWWHESLTHVQFLAHFASWCMLLLPVPAMRVILHDHTLEQVFTGAVFGILHALIWWRFSRILQRRYRNLEDVAFPATGCCKKRFFHDFKLPYVPDVVLETSHRAGEQLQGRWTRTQSGHDGVIEGKNDFRVVSTDSDTRLRVEDYPGSFTSWNLSIRHADSQQASLSFKNTEGATTFRNGRAREVRFRDGTVWVRRSVQRETSLQGAERNALEVNSAGPSFQDGEERPAFSLLARVLSSPGSADSIPAPALSSRQTSGYSAASAQSTSQSGVSLDLQTRRPARPSASTI